MHACKLVNNVAKTETQMQLILRDPQHVSGYGLLVKINDRNQRLLLDTGASGILINRKAAEKAGLKRVSTVQFTGIGDRGHQGAYLAVADQIRIGELEFRDCVVTVSEKSMGLDEDGLIGGDVFSSYVVDIDIPADKLRLDPLPRRPEDSTRPASLASESDSDYDPEEPPDTANGSTAAAKPGAEKGAATPLSAPTTEGPLRRTRNGEMGQSVSRRTQPADSHPCKRFQHHAVHSRHRCDLPT